MNLVEINRIFDNTETISNIVKALNALKLELNSNAKTSDDINSISKILTYEVIRYEI